MSGKRLSQRALREMGIAEDQITPASCGVDMCHVPVPHRHEPPTEAQVLESRETMTLEHPPTCAWRRDIYDGCSCGMTGLVTQLWSLHAVVSQGPASRPVPAPEPSVLPKILVGMLERLPRERVWSDDEFDEWMTMFEGAIRVHYRTPRRAATPQDPEA